MDGIDGCNPPPSAFAMTRSPEKQPRPVPATEEKQLPIATKQGLALKKSYCTSSAGSMEEQ